MRHLRREMQIIFQDPYASLNPRMTVGDIVAEPLQIHKLAFGKDVDTRVNELLRTVGLSPYHANRYPHEFSGGQRQRIGVARALAVNPKFIVADEPVSALDVSIQAQVVNLLQDLQDRLGLTYLFIAHDLSGAPHLRPRRRHVRRQTHGAGRPRRAVRAAPPSVHAVAPRRLPILNRARGAKRSASSGGHPSPVNPPSGCRFHTRCPIAFDRCVTEVPKFTDYGGHWVACHKVEELKGDQPQIRPTTLARIAPVA